MPAPRARPRCAVTGFGLITPIGTGRDDFWRGVREGRRGVGPITRPDAPVRMSAVHYLLPLQDGRALVLRLAATPEKFNELGPRMKQSLDTFKLLTRVAEAR